MELMNLCPHDVNVRREDGSTRVIKQSGTVARCQQSETVLSMIDGIPIIRKTYGVVQGLPDEIPGLYYIVSATVAKECPNRHDLLCPGPLVKDVNGNIIGCNGLLVMWTSNRQ